MFARTRLVDWLIFILGIAMVIDVSTRLPSAGDFDGHWQPVIESPECCTPDGVDTLPTVLTA